MSKNYFLIFIFIILLGCSEKKENNNNIDLKEWYSVGEQGELSQGAVYSTAIAVDKKGNPIIAYTDAGANETISIKKYINNKWEIIGNKNVSPSSSYIKKILVDNNDNIYILYIDYSVKVNNELCGKPTIKKFDGYNWITLGNERFTEFATLYTDMVIDNDNNIYLAVNNESDNNKLILYKFIDNKWEIFAKDITGRIGEIKLLLDSNNNILFVCLNTNLNNTSEMNRLLIKKFIDGSWKEISNQTFNRYVFQFDACLDEENNLYIARNDYTTKNLNIIKYNLNKEKWEDLEIVDDADSYGDILINVNKDNILNIFYDQLYLGQIKEYKDGKWNTGKVVSYDKVSNASMVIASDNTVFLAFEDGANNFKIAVKKYLEIK